MFTKTEQRYLKSVLKDVGRRLESAITHSRQRENPDEKHIQKLEKKLETNKRMIEKLDV